jgi:hypothetical protein
VPHEIPTKSNAKVENSKTALVARTHIIERNITTLLIRPLGLGRGRRRLHVFRRFLVIEAFESIDTHRAVLPPTANFTRGVVKHSTTAMDDQCLHGLPITEPLFGDTGIHDRGRQIHQAIPRYGTKRSHHFLVSPDTGLWKRPKFMAEIAR